MLFKMLHAFRKPFKARTYVAYECDYNPSDGNVFIASSNLEFYCYFLTRQCHLLVFIEREFPFAGRKSLRLFTGINELFVGRSELMALILLLNINDVKVNKPLKYIVINGAGV